MPTDAPVLAWLRRAMPALERLAATQVDVLETASQWCAEAIAGDGLVHLFGTGHSRIPVEEMFPRYGSYPGFNPIVELSMTFHTQVVGANGQRQAMAIERMPGLAGVILSNFAFGPKDVMMVFSAGGATAVPVEMARGARARELRARPGDGRASGRRGRSGHRLVYASRRRADRHRRRRHPGRSGLDDRRGRRRQ
jgi:uncharacterized phosphosugar-binding protein